MRTLSYIHAQLTPKMMRYRHKSLFVCACVSLYDDCPCAAKKREQLNAGRSGGSAGLDDADYDYDYDEDDYDLYVSRRSLENTSCMCPTQPHSPLCGTTCVRLNVTWTVGRRN